MTLGGLQVFDAKLLEHLAAEAGEPISLGAFKGGLSIMFATAGFLGMLAGWLCAPGETLGWPAWLAAQHMCAAVCVCARARARARANGHS